MAENRGGYRKPNNPAPASGPGALSRRTDGGPADKQPVRDLPNAAYGEGKAFREQQQAAPMQGGGRPTPTPAPLSAPTAQPGEPVTAGANAGAGIDMRGAGIAADLQGDMANLAPVIHSLEMAANMPGSNPSTRAFVRKLKAMAGE